MYLSSVYRTRATEDDKFLFEIALCHNGFSVKEVNYRFSFETVASDKGAFCAQAYELLRSTSMKSLDELVIRSGYDIRGISSLDKFIAYFTGTSVVTNKRLYQYKGALRSKEKVAQYVTEIYAESKTYYKELVNKQITALYAQIPQLVAGLKKRFIAFNSKYYNMVRENPAILLNIESDFVAWVNKNCGIDNLDPYEVTDLERIIGSRIKFFFSYWCDEKLGDYLDANQIISVNGDAVAASDLRSIEIKSKNNANIYEIMANLNEINHSLFYHSSSGTKEPIYYTIVEWYVSRALAPKMNLLNSSYDRFLNGCTDEVRLMKVKQSPNIFKLEKSYGVNRPQNPDYEFKQKIKNNIQTLEEAYKIYQRLTTKNFLAMIRLFAWNIQLMKGGMRRSSGCLNDVYFVENVDYVVRSGESPALRTKNNYLYGDYPIMLTDRGIEHAKKLMNCFDDLKQLEDILAGYGLTLVDLPIARVFSYEEYKESISIEGLLSKSLFKVSPSISKLMYQGLDPVRLTLTSCTDCIVHQYDTKPLPITEGLETFSQDSDESEEHSEDDSTRGLETLLPRVDQYMDGTAVKKYAILLREMGGYFYKDARSTYHIDSIEKSAYEICIYSRKNVSLERTITVICYLLWFGMSDERCMNLAGKLIGIADKEILKGVISAVSTDLKTFEEVCKANVIVDQMAFNIVERIKQSLSQILRLIVVDHRVLYDTDGSQYLYRGQDNVFQKITADIRVSQTDILIKEYENSKDYKATLSDYINGDKVTAKAYAPYAQDSNYMILSLTELQARVFNFIFNNCKEVFRGNCSEMYEDNNFILSDRILNAEFAYDYCGQVWKQVFDSIIAPIYLMARNTDTAFTIINKANIVKNIENLDKQITNVNRFMEIPSVTRANLTKVVGEMGQAGIYPVLNLEDYVTTKVYSLQMVSDVQLAIASYVNGNLLKNLNAIRNRVAKYEYEIERDIGFGKTLSSEMINNRHIVDSLLFAIKEYLKDPRSMMKLLAQGANSKNKKELDSYKPYTVGEQGLLMDETGSYYLSQGEITVNGETESVFYLIHELGAVISIVGSQVNIRGLSEERHDLFPRSVVYS